MALGHGLWRPLAFLLLVSGLPVAAGIVINTIDVRLPEADWYTLNRANTENFEMPCSVIMGGETFDFAEIELHGTSGRMLPKKNYRLKFDKDYTPRVNWFGDPYPQEERLRRVVLKSAFHDSSFLREKLVMDMSTAIGLPAPRVSYAELFVNGEYAGFYLVIDRVDGNWLDKSMGWDEDGNLYKANTHAANWAGAPLLYENGPFEKKTNAEQPSEDLFVLYQALNANLTTYLDWQAVVEPVFNTKDYIVYSVVHLLAMNMDGFDKNYYLYHQAGEPMRMIGWDADAVWGIDFLGRRVDTSDDSLRNPGEETDYMHPKIFAVPEYRSLWLNMFAELTEPGGLFSTDQLQKRVREQAAAIRAAAVRGTWVGHASFDHELEILLQAIQDRVDAVRAGLQREFAADARVYRASGQLRTLQMRFPSAGDILVAGRDINCLWDSLMVGTLALGLRSGATNEVIELESFVINDGNHRLRLPLDLPPGLYKIEVQDLSWGGARWESSPFQVLAEGDLAWFQGAFTVHMGVDVDVTAVYKGMATHGPHPEVFVIATRALSHYGCATTCLEDPQCVAFSFSDQFQGCTAMGMLQPAEVTLSDLPIWPEEFSIDVYIKDWGRAQCLADRGCDPLQLCSDDDHYSDDYSDDYNDHDAAEPASPDCGRCPRQAPLGPDGGCEEEEEARALVTAYTANLVEILPGCACVLSSLSTMVCGRNGQQYRSRCEAFCFKQHNGIRLGPCLNCPTGMSPHQTEQSRCVPCPENTFKNTVGPALCERCPDGLISSLGAAACRPSCGCEDDEGEPVCAGGVIEYANACVAQCSGHQNYTKGKCEMHGVLKIVGGMCLDSVMPKQAGRPPLMWPCTPMQESQRWVFNPSTRQLSVEGGVCIDAPEPNLEGGKVVLSACDPLNSHQHWLYVPKSLQIRNDFGLCLRTAERNKPGGKVTLWPCDPDDPSQKWLLFDQGRQAVSARLVAQLPPHLPIMGHLQFRASGCLAAHAVTGVLGVAECEDGATIQHFFYMQTQRRLMHVGGLCVIDVATQGQEGDSSPRLGACSSSALNQRWDFDPLTGHVRAASGMCLHMPNIAVLGQALTTAECQADSPHQRLLLRARSVPSESLRSLPGLPTRFLPSCPAFLPPHRLCCSPACPRAARGANRQVCKQAGVTCVFDLDPLDLERTGPCSLDMTVFGNVHICADKSLYMLDVYDQLVLVAADGEHGNPASAFLSVSAIDYEVDCSFYDYDCAACIEEGCKFHPRPGKKHACRDQCADDTDSLCYGRFPSRAPPADRRACPSFDLSPGLANIVSGMVAMPASEFVPYRPPPTPSAHGEGALLSSMARPSQPRLVAAHARSASSLSLVWAPPSLHFDCGADRFRVRYKPASNTTWTVAFSENGFQEDSLPFITIAGLLPGTRYDVQVWAVNRGEKNSQPATRAFTTRR